MAKWRFDRTSIFLIVVGLLFLWDVAYYAGIRNPDLFPHPFRVFRLLGASDYFGGFLVMLRLIILCFVPGGLIGVALGSLILRSSWLTQGMLRFLRLGLWLPFVLLFAVPTAWTLGAAVMLCSCYHYLGARFFLDLQGQDALTHAAREAILQALLISLISQIWIGWWKWFEFAALYQPGTGFQTLIMLLILVFCIDWFFRSNFATTAQRRGTILANELTSANWSSFFGSLLVTIVLLAIWQAFSQSPFHFFRGSLVDALKAGYDLLERGELLGDIKVSLLEVVVGMVFGASIALLVFGGLSTIKPLRSLISRVLPLTYISPIVLWLLAWLFPAFYMAITPNWVGFWHKVVAVGLLSFFPFVQALWGLRNHPLYFGILLAIDDALPIAFVAMMFGELWASTAGLGFMMTVASATYQIDKGLAGFLTTVVLLVGLSSTLRWTAKGLYFPESNARAY